MKHARNSRFSDICDDLKGKYPKDFKFTGWHPWCRCYAVPILPSVEEFADFDMEAGRHEGEITDVPQGFKNWVGKNEERIENAKSMPSFLKDNTKYWEGMEKKWKREAEKGNVFTFATPQRSYVDAKNDKVTFRLQQKEVNEALKKAGNISLENDDLYTGKLYSDKHSREALIGHSYDTDELNVIEHLPNILSGIKYGERQNLDKSNHLYDKKVKDKWQYMTVYNITINGTAYVLKCAAIKHDGYPIFEHPYSLKKKR